MKFCPELTIPITISFSPSLKTLLTLTGHNALLWTTCSKLFRRCTFIYFYRELCVNIKSKLFSTKSLQITVRVYHYHEGDSLENYDKHTFLGESTFLLANLVVTHDQKMSPHLVSGKAKGNLELRLESHTNTRDLFVAAFSGVRLSNKDGFFGTSDPFLVVSRCEKINAFLH